MTQANESQVRIRRAVGFLCLALWVASLLVPAAKYCHAYNHDDHLYGGEILALGWMGWAVGQFGWLANPLMLWVIVCLLRGLAAGPIVASIAFVLALTSFSFDRVADDTGYIMLCGHEVGFYLWELCALLPAVMALREVLWGEAHEKTENKVEVPIEGGRPPYSDFEQGEVR